MSNDFKYLLVFGIIIVGVIYGSSIGFFSIAEYKSPVVQYYNEPIAVEFLATTESEPTITAFFNGADVTDSIETIQGTEYKKVIYNANTAGVFRVVVSDGETSDDFAVEVKKPYIESKNNIPASIKKGEKATLKISTYDPSQNPLEADSIEVTVELPSSEIKTIDFTKDGSSFTAEYTFRDAGGYNFKWTARKQGYQAVERGAITSVVGQDEPHPIFYVWGIGFGGLILLLLIRWKRGRSLWH